MPPSLEGKRNVDGDGSNIASKRPAIPAAGAPTPEELREIAEIAMSSLRRAKQAGALTPHQADAIAGADGQADQKTKDVKTDAPRRPTFWLP